MTCRFRAHTTYICAGRLEHCPPVTRAFGPTQRMCRRCDADAGPHRMLCAECQAKYGRTAYEKLQERKAGSADSKIMARRRRARAETGA